MLYKLFPIIFNIHSIKKVFTNKYNLSLLFSTCLINIEKNNINITVNLNLNIIKPNNIVFKKKKGFFPSYLEKDNS